MIDPSDQVIDAPDLKVGDLVDLESCCQLADWPSAEYEYATVLDVYHLEGGDVRVEYEGIPGPVYYRSGWRLRIVPRSNHPPGYYEQFEENPA